MAGNFNFKEETGEMQFDASGNLKVNIQAGSAADGAIVDGVSSSIKATVFDYSNSNPLAVVLRDTNGDYVSVGGGTQYTEDVAAAADPVGTAVNLVRADTPGAITSTNGDNVAQRGTNYGAAFVQVVNSSGSFVDTIGGGTQDTEDVASVADPVGNQLIARRRDSLSAETTTDGDNTALNSTSKGELYVKHVDTIAVTQSGTWDEVGINDSGNSITVDDGGSSLTVDGTVSVSGTVTVDSELPTAAALADNTANPTVPAVGAFLMGFDGTNWDRVRADGGSVFIQDGGNSITVDGTVSVTGVATETTLSSLLTSSQLIDDTIIVLGTDTYTEATSKGQIIAAEEMQILLL